MTIGWLTWALWALDMVYLVLYHRLPKPQELHFSSSRIALRKTDKISSLRSVHSAYSINNAFNAVFFFFVLHQLLVKTAQRWTSMYCSQINSTIIHSIQCAIIHRDNKRFDERNEKMRQSETERMVGTIWTLCDVDLASS